jgi:hypothetical protein
LAVSDIAAGEGAEQWEHVLVEVEGVEVTQEVEMFGEFEVDGSLIVTDFFVFTTGESLFPQMGQQIDSITGPLLYSFERYKLAPRSLEDIEGYEPPPPEMVTIFDIREGNVSQGKPIVVQDLVVTSPVVWAGNGFYAQEMEGGVNSGIFVFVNNPDGLSVSPGDIVTVTGGYTEYFDNAQIAVDSPSAIETTGSGMAPAPELVDAATLAGAEDGEPYEGVLVMVENVTVTANDAGFGEFSVTGGLIVDDQFWAEEDWTIPDVDTSYTSITGLMNYSFETRKLEPRTTEDLVQ